MTPRERIKRTLDFKIPDRVGIYDCLWDETCRIWQQQNFLPKEKPYQEFFGYDLRLFEVDQSFLLMEKELGSDAETVTRVNSFGITEKSFRQRSGSSQVTDAAVKTKKDWQDFKPLLEPCRARIKASFRNEYDAARKAGAFLTLAVMDPFQHAVSIFGMERLLMLVGDNPKLVSEVFLCSAELSIGMCNLLRHEGLVFDGAWLWSDLAYKNGCYFSVSTYKNLLYPQHRRLCTYFNSKAMPVIFHSDGNFLGLVPLLLKAGVRALNPLETDCGFNLEYMKREYGADAVLFGNIETEILQKDRHDIELTLSRRLETAKKGGGFIYHGDKPVPPGIDFHNYEFALEMVQKHGRY